MEALYSKKGLYANTIAIVIFFSLPIYDSINHFVNYKRNLGLDENVFGYPKQFSEIGFNFFILVLTFLAVIALFRIHKFGWHSANILVFFVIFMLLLEEVNLVSNYIGYFNWIYCIYFIILLWFIIYLNTKKIKHLFQIESTQRFLQVVLVLVLTLLWFFSGSR